MRRPALVFSAALALSARTAAADDVLVRGESGAANFSSRATIEDAPREVTDAASLVEPLPGVHVRRLGADDSFATLSIRGSSSSQVAVYLAGVPLSGGADPTLDLATLPLWPGARATVHRTFAPAALGPGSLGGTLTIDPPGARAPNATDVWMAVGSFGSRRLRLGNVSGADDGVKIATGFSASRSDDDFSYLDVDPTAAAGHDVYRTRQNAGHVAVAGLASVAIPIRLAGPDGALTVTSLAQARRQELPGSTSYETPFQRLDSTRIVEALELTLPTTRGAIGARAWGRREGLNLHDNPDALATFGGASSTDDAILAVGGSAGWRGRPVDPLLLEIRVDGSGERFAPGTWVGAIAPPGATRANAGLAADLEYQLDRVTLSGSARGDAWFDQSDPAGPSSGSTSDHHYRPTGHVGVEVPVSIGGTDVITLAAHGGWVSRAPSFVERFGNRGAFLGAPNLRAESAFTTDAGGHGEWRLGPVRLHAELNGFATWADDLITFIYVGAQRKALSTNIGQARLLGVESEARATAYGFDARVSYTGLATANEDVCLVEVVGQCTRPSLPGRPAHDLVVDLAYEVGPLKVRYGLDYVGGIRFDANGAIPVPGRVLHSAGARLSVPGVRGLSLSLDVRNLLDLRVAEYPGPSAGSITRAPIGDLYDYPLPGRRILVSVEWKD